MLGIVTAMASSSKFFHSLHASKYCFLWERELVWSNLFQDTDHREPLSEPLNELLSTIQTCFCVPLFYYVSSEYQTTLVTFLRKFEYMNFAIIFRKKLKYLRKQINSYIIRIIVKKKCFNRRRNWILLFDASWNTNEKDSNDPSNL